MELGLSGASVFVAAASKGLGLEETDCDESAVFTVEMDLSDADAIESGISSAVEEFGGLDVLVTNHGGPNNASFEDTSLEAFDGGYNDVLRSTVVQCKAALPALRDGGGAITHLVAASAAEPTAHGTLGNVFRPGIYGLSKTLANEEGKSGVRSNCVAPRGVLSDRIESKIAARAEREGLTEAEVRELRVAELPLPEMGTTEEFGKAVAFVSSPAASYVTGSVLPVDGGWSSRLL